MSGNHERRCGGSRLATLWGVATGVLVLGLAGPGSAHAARWSFQALPAGTAPLSAIACTSVTACTAVGGSSVVHWNGTRWTAELAPAVPSPGWQSVSCTSRRFCVAVGGSDAARWNGVRWSLQRVPPTLRELLSVSCTSERSCLAVGGSRAARWNGSRWSATRKPGAQDLESVSCSTATACVGVGEGAVPFRMYSALWDGLSWSLKTGPPSVDGDFIDAVSCATATACTAVGPAFGSWGPGNSVPSLPTAARWNGERWSKQRMAGGQDILLGAVSCPSAVSCTAVGSTAPSAVDVAFVRPLAERWNGATWSIQPTPDPPLPARFEAVAGPTLTGVACPRVRFCIAVGVDFGVPDAPIAERYS